MAEVPQLQRRMALEDTNLMDQIHEESKSIDPLPVLARLVLDEDPKDLSDLNELIEEFLNEYSVDESSQKSAGEILAAMAMAAAHYDGRLVENWPGVDAFENEDYWRTLSGADDGTWLRLTEYAVANAREAQVSLVWGAVVRVSAIMGAPVDTFKDLSELQENQLMLAGGALAAMAVAGYAAWASSSVKSGEVESLKVKDSKNDVIIYVAREDSTTRTEHLALNGFAFKRGSDAAKDPRVWAPNGPNCRCTNQVIRGQAATEVVTSDKSPFKGKPEEGWKIKPGAHPSGVARDVPKSIRKRLGDPRSRPRILTMGKEKIDVNAYKADEKVLKKYDNLHPDSPKVAKKWGYFKSELEWIEEKCEFLYKKRLDKLGIDPREAWAIQNYTYNSDYTWNTYLRTGRKVGYQAYGVSSNASVVPGIKAAISGMNKLPVYKGTAYRGAMMSPDHMNSYSKGVQVRPKSFLSTSQDKSAAFWFAEDGGTLFEIESKSGVRIEPFSIFEGEAEVLFKPNTTFEVVNVKKDKIRGGLGFTANVTVVKMKEV